MANFLFRFSTEHFVDCLMVMLKGMGGIFLIIGLIAVTIYFLGRFSAKKQK